MSSVVYLCDICGIFAISCRKSEERVGKCENMENREIWKVNKNKKYKNAGNDK